MANYFDVGPTIIRLGFIMLSFGGGSGILIYLILSVIIPKEPGKEVPLDRTEKVREMVEDIGDKTRDFIKDDEKSRKTNRTNRKKVLGLFLMAVGGLALWNRVMPFYINSEFVWPIALMLIGLLIVFK